MIMSANLTVRLPALLLSPLQTVSSSVGPVGRLLTAVGRLSPGHRLGTWPSPGHRLAVMSPGGCRLAVMSLDKSELRVRFSES